MNDEIDIFEIFLDLWEGKIKIISSVVIALLIALGFNFFYSKPNFEATTEIKPLFSFQSQPYNLFNSYTENFQEQQDNSYHSNFFFKITPQNLLSLYVEQLEYKTLFVKAVDELGVFQKSDFETVEDYNKAILRFVSNIEIIHPVNDEKIKPDDLEKYHKIKFTYDDQKIWGEILSNFNAYCNEFIRQQLIKRFNQNLSIAKQKKNFLLEDIQFQIENVFTDYDKETLNRLAFLDEQKQIARKLGVAKNTIETQIFDTKNGTVANFKTDTPFYLRGYEAIEEEIKILKNRDDKRLFINNLIELENQKRALEQDKTLERSENLFVKTPLVTKDNFVVVNLDIEDTDFKIKNNKIPIMILALFIGGFIGVIYVLISNSIKTRKIKKSLY